MLTKIFSSKKRKKRKKEPCIAYYVGGELWLNIWIKVFVVLFQWIPTARSGEVGGVGGLM